MFDSLLFQEYLAIALPTASCQLSNVGDMLVCPQPAVQLLFDSFAFEKTRQLIQLLLGARTLLGAPGIATRNKDATSIGFSTSMWKLLKKCDLSLSPQLSKHSILQAPCRCTGHDSQMPAHSTFVIVVGISTTQTLYIIYSRYFHL